MKQLKNIVISIFFQVIFKTPLELSRGFRQGIFSTNSARNSNIWFENKSIEFTVVPKHFLVI
jgi:hypothetical protein